MSRHTPRKERCIVCARTALSEKDFILTLLSSEGEQMRAVAKGARKPGSRLAARTDLYCVSDFLLAEGKSLYIVSEASLVDDHAELKSYECSFAAAVLVEIARVSSFEGEKDPFLYGLLDRSLRALAQAQTRAQIDLCLASYVFKISAHGGWRPELEACSICGDTSLRYFSARAGGVVCESCHNETLSDALAIAPSQIELIKQLIVHTFDELLTLTLTDEEALFICSCAHIWASTHLDARLKSFEFYMTLQ